MKVQEQNLNRSMGQIGSPSILRSGTIGLNRMTTIVEGNAITDEGKQVKAIRGGGGRRMTVMPQ